MNADDLISEVKTRAVGVRGESQAITNALAAGDIDALSRALPPQQMNFCREYVVDFNGKAAAIRAGYAPKWADRTSHTLRKQRGIATMIDHLAMSKEAKITAVDPDYVIARVTQIIDGSSKDGDKLRGLELLARHLGMLRDRTEISGPDGGAIQTEEIENESNEFRRRIASIAKRGGAGRDALSVVPGGKS